MAMSVDQIAGKELLEMAPTIDLTPREFKVMLTIVLRGVSSPPEIADRATVPRSKIYEVLETLEEKKIIQVQNGKYTVVPSEIKYIRMKYEKNSNNFKKLLRYVENYATRPREPYIEIMKKDLNHLFTELRYDISSVPIPEISEDRLNRFATTARSNDRISESIQFVATSRDSGNKVAVVFMESEQSERISMEVAYLLPDLVRTLGIHTMVLVYSPDLTHETLDIIKRRERMLGVGERDENISSRFRSGPRIIACSMSELTEAKMKEISDYFSDFDEHWRHSRRDLQNLSKPLEDSKRSLAIATTTVSEIRYDVDRINQYTDVYDIDKINQYTDVLKEVIDRVGADMKSYEEFYNSLADDYHSLLNNLEEQKILPDEKGISKLSSGIEFLNHNIYDGNRELSTIRQEIDYFKKKDETYKRYGFSINPFIFTVPFSSPNEMVDQEEAKGSLDAFLYNIGSGSENRTLVIADEFGKGKTHLMYYFKKRIVDKKYGKILPLYIKCPPRYPEVDIIDLYSQILLEVRKQWEYIDKKLVKNVYETMSKSTPRDTNEFILTLRKILTQTYDSGYNRIILMIDEFENMLPEKISRKVRTRTESNPRTLLQLKSLMDILDIAFVLAVRKTTWDSWQEKLLTALDNKDVKVINLQPLDVASTTELINQRMGLRENPTKNIEFTSEAINDIVKQSNGIPRNIVKLAREALRTAILDDRDLVQKEDVVQKLVQI